MKKDRKLQHKTAECAVRCRVVNCHKKAVAEVKSPNGSGLIVCKTHVVVLRELYRKLYGKRLQINLLRPQPSLKKKSTD